MRATLGDRLPPAMCGTLARIALATVMAFCAVNYAYHYHVLPESIRHSALGYFLVVQLPFGVAIPSALLGLHVRRTGRDLSSVGMWRSARDLSGALIGLCLGALLICLAVGPQQALTRRVGVLFGQLLVASTAEVFVFTALLLAVARGWCRAMGRWRDADAVLMSAAGFGLFHFTYPPPWANWQVAIGLAVVWVLVSVVFIATRTVLGAIVFNNSMAVIGFVQNGLTLPGGIVASAAQWVVALGVAWWLSSVTSRGHAAMES